MNIKKVSGIPYFGVVMDVFVVDSFAYLGIENNLVILNVSDYMNPVVLGSISLDGEMETYYKSKLFVLNNYVYYLTAETLLNIVDVSNPSNPVKVSEYILPYGDITSVSVLGNYAYVVSNGDLKIIDVTNPSNPFEVSNYDSIGYYIYISGNYAFVAGGNLLRVLDIIDPLNPVKIGYCEVTENIKDVYISENYAYLITTSSLKVIDVTSPSNPFELGYCSIDGFPEKVYVLDNYAYVASSVGLRIINIQDPVKPFEVSYYDTPSSARGVYVFDNYAYVASSDAGLRIIDVTDPSKPVEVGYYDTPGSAQRVYIIRGYNKNYALVADGDAGLRVIDVTNPLNPVEVAYYDTEGFTKDVCFSRNYFDYKFYIYLLDNSGFYILTFLPENGILGDKVVEKRLNEREEKIKFTGKEIIYNITSCDNEIRIFDITGKETYRESKIETGEKQYNLKNLSKGVYFIKLKDGKIEIKKKIFVIY
ncbi:MAG: T9SS type A sorting domain-containing protein [candidate division WOR-3 bacterium]